MNHPRGQCKPQSPEPPLPAWGRVRLVTSILREERRNVDHLGISTTQSKILPSGTDNEPVWNILQDDSERPFSYTPREAA
jgi:hypothetical protein